MNLFTTATCFYFVTTIYNQAACIGTWMKIAYMLATWLVHACSYLELATHMKVAVIHSMYTFEECSNSSNIIFLYSLAIKTTKLYWPLYKILWNFNQKAHNNSGNTL